MKKLFAFIALLGVLSFGYTQTSFAQDQQATGTSVTNQSSVSQTNAASAADEEEVPLNKMIKTKFIEGGAGFMAVIILCLIFGLAICIERILYLSLSTTNTKKLLLRVEEALNNGGIEEAKDVCRNSRGPVASIFYQGLDRFDEGIEVVEKSVVSYGSVQMSLLEKGMTWIQLFIAVAPMLGFMGTVIGMIGAFDNIQKAGDISATIVAGGIKVALITTVTGLIVAIILQIFYNYIVTKIDDLVLDMEDSSISLVDIIVKYDKK